MKPFLFIFLFSNVRAHGIWRVMCFTDIVVQMISSLSFKQENTIADQPVVDVLKYLNTKLDEAVARERLPSGWNPLQQLILIIGDGRFHERVIFFSSSFSKWPTSRYCCLSTVSFFLKQNQLCRRT